MYNSWVSRISWNVSLSVEFDGDLIGAIILINLESFFQKDFKY